MVVDLRKKYLTDKKAETSGVWNQYEGYRVRLARYNCPENIEYTSKFYKEHADSNGNLSPEKAVELAIGQMQILVKDWENVGIDGKEAKATPENIRIVLEDNDDLYLLWLKDSKEAENYNAERLKESAKNLPSA